MAIFMGTPILTGLREAAEKLLAGETACPTWCCNSLILRGGAGGFACARPLQKSFSAAS
jgi:hypothetical protein